jgi:signal peptidase II
MRRLALVFALLVSTVGCDQATKALARESLSVRRLSYLGDILRLQHSENPGAFLSLGADLQGPLRFWIFTVGVSAFVLAAFWIVVRKRNLDRWTTVALTLVIAGGVGNLIDRAVKGTVTDFMNVGIGALRTGIFNVADMAIVAGVGILMAQSLRESESQATPVAK